MAQFDLLGSLMRNLHGEFVTIYYLMLPVCFALAIAVSWFRAPQGSPEFVDVLKRAIISTVLLAAFPDITHAIVFVVDGITSRIDSMNTLDTIIRMAQEKAKTYSLTPTSILLQFNDLIIATLSFLSYLRRAWSSATRPHFRSSIWTRELRSSRSVRGQGRIFTFIRTIRGSTFSSCRNVRTLPTTSCISLDASKPKAYRNR